MGKKIPIYKKPGRADKDYWIPKIEGDMNKLNDENKFIRNTRLAWLGISLTSLITFFGASMNILTEIVDWIILSLIFIFLFETIAIIFFMWSYDKTKLSIKKFQVITVEHLNLLTLITLTFCISFFIYGSFRPFRFLSYIFSIYFGIFFIALVGILWIKRNPEERWKEIYNLYLKYKNITIFSVFLHLFIVLLCFYSFTLLPTYHNSLNVSIIIFWFLISIIVIWAMRIIGISSSKLLLNKIKLSEFEKILEKIRKGRYSEEKAKSEYKRINNMKGYPNY